MKVKRITALLLSLTMILTLIPTFTATAFAESAENLYKFDETTGTITGVKDTTITEALIPETINGVAVKAIGTRAFFDCRDSLKTVSIPKGVTSIGKEAFYCCRQLESVSLPNGLQTIGKNAFRTCEILKDVNIPSTVNYIGDCAFGHCYKIESLTIPSGITEIIDNTFMSCKSLKTVKIPYSVTSIGDWAFAGCESLTNVTISDNVTKIGKYAFDDCQGIKNLVIPDSVKSIGIYAFEGCRYMKSITLPSGITEIGGGMFSRCYELKSVVIPNTVTKVGSNVFSLNFELENIVFPNSVEEIDYIALERSDNLKDIYYVGTREQWEKINILYHMGSSYDSSMLTFIPLTFTAPEDLEYDGTEKAAAVTTTNTEIGAITVKYYNEKNEEVEPITPGKYKVKIDISANDKHSAVSGIEAGTFTIVKGDSQTAASAAKTTVTYGEDITITADVSISNQRMMRMMRAANSATAAKADTVDFYVKAGEDEILLGTAEVQYADSAKKDGGTASLTIKTTDKLLQPGVNKVMAEYGGSVNLNGSGSDEISVTLEKKEVGLQWSGHADRIFDESESDVKSAVTGVESGDGDITVTVSSGKESAAGTHTATATELVGANAMYYKLPQNPTCQYKILDVTKPVISGIENGATYCSAQTVTVTDNAIDTVTVNGKPVSLDANGKFVLNPAEGVQKIVATDKSGNYAEMSATVNDGHTPKADDGSCLTAVDCEFCGEIAIAAKSEHAWSDWEPSENYRGRHERKCTSSGCVASETGNCMDEVAPFTRCDKCGADLFVYYPTQKSDLSWINEQLPKLKFVARSTKTVKKNVRVTIKADEDTASTIEAIGNLGYTVKYKYYRSLKKSSGYKAMLLKSDKTYLNTYGVKNAMYYYKVRVMIYDKSNNLVAKSELKQCSYANRRWSR